MITIELNICENCNKELKGIPWGEINYNLTDDECDICGVKFYDNDEYLWLIDPYEIKVDLKDLLTIILRNLIEGR